MFAYGNVNLHADSDLTSVDLGYALASSLFSTPMGTGGLETPAQAGVGLTAGVNVFTDTTEAYIANVANAPKFKTPGSVHADGDVSVRATNQEVLVGFSLAGAVATGASPPSRPRSGDVSDVTARRRR